MKQHRLFLKNTLSLVFALYLTVGAFNLIVDPYGIYNLVEIEGFNNVKPPWDNQQRMVKILQLRKIRPKGIILGSSRTNYGLDPEHVAWKSDSKPVYNLSVPFTSIEETYSLLKYANSLNDLNIVIIGLDFFAFNIFHPNTTNSNEFNNFLDFSSITKDGDTKISSLLKEFQNTLFSSTATEKSFKTITYKGKQSRSSYGQKIFIDERGSKELSNLAYGWILSTLWFPDKKNKMFCLYNENAESKKFAKLGEIINFSIQNNIQLKMFINPVHADLLEMIRFMGLWSIYDNWKSDLVNLIAAINKRELKETPISLWDFGDYNSITTEKISLSNDFGETMQGYIDLAHYKKSVGDLILGKLLTHINSQEIINNDFGHLINTQNIKKKLINSKGNQLEYQNKNRKYLEEIRILWKKYKDRYKSYPCIY